MNCSVTGSPAPVVTWEHQYYGTSGFSPVVINQSNGSSRYFIKDNGQVNIILLLTLLLTLLQKLCFNDIINYLSIDNTYYLCNANNVGGSTYGMFNVRVSKLCLHCFQ